ncbi:MAG: A/G-specific adenine glycosylase [Flavobacteriaceae bacterium]|nr:A/G-specific adenine glycosylase [Flavobacteriaceae bacterium]
MWFGNKLISWYLQNKRDLPWRETKDPYAIWLSEIMLQQTRVAQGLPYFEKFLTQFPTVFDLANASEEQVLKLWQGLGYYSRARNLHATAKHIAFDNKGKFPSTYEGLLKLKGVGDYTASAIASICFKLPTAVVDGNVYRVLSRVFGIATPINSTSGIAQFKALAQKLIDPSCPGTFNQAIMEFGARFCVPSNPDCSTCIFSDVCIANKQKQVPYLPVKVKKAVVKNEFYNYLVCLFKDRKTLMEQRTDRGIWQNLYQFPLIESKKQLQVSTLKKDQEFIRFSEQINIQSISKFNDRVIVHKLSHKHLYTTFWILEIDALYEGGVPFSEIHLLPVPVLIQNFIYSFLPFKN